MGHLGNSDLLGSQSNQRGSQRIGGRYAVNCVAPDCVRSDLDSRSVVRVREAVHLRRSQWQTTNTSHTLDV